jgi:hypothetical protein
MKSVEGKERKLPRGRLNPRYSTFVTRGSHLVLDTRYSIFYSVLVTLRFHTVAGAK